ncbi:MAG: hypothetical protein ACK56W_15530 [Pirellula sp.]|jgi:hypothetical protein|nr:hypothetical protein [Pirellula sp.]
MTRHINQSVTSYFSIAVVTLAIVHSGQAQERTNIQLLESITGALKTASVSEIKIAIVEVEEALNRLRESLSEQAIGIILSKELQIDSLATELQKDMPDVIVLHDIERSLSRILPGKVQVTMDRLRGKVSNLAKLLRLSPAGLNIARQSIASISDHLQNEQLRQSPVGDRNLRQAFAELNQHYPSDLDVAMLGKRISGANYSSLIKKDFLTAISQRSFDLPIHLRECKDGTSIVGNGKLNIALSLELPPSNGEISMFVNATGAGTIDVSADRNKIHICGQLSPHIQGQQPLHIRPSQVSGDTPTVNARLSTQLTQVKIDGLLGRLRVSERLAARVIQNKLDANERSVSEKIEKTVQDRVQDEGFDLLYRINGLIQHGVWDRIQSLDYKPEVHMQNDSQGIHTDTRFVSRNQLGALTKRPEIAPDRYQQLDLITWVHESALNNIFESFGSVRLDEATIRGLWETQFKLTSEEWKNLPPARIPAAITLADQSPLKVRFVTNGLEVLLRASSCELDGHFRDNVPREFTVRYLIANTAHGAEFSRQPLVFPIGLEDDKVAVWTQALDLFFGKAIRPMPKFRNASFSSFLRVGYLNLTDGWLVIGVTRSTVSTAPSSRSAEEVSR